MVSHYPRSGSMSMLTSFKSLKFKEKSFESGFGIPFATFIDRHVLEMASFFVWLSKNPAEAVKIKGAEAKLRFQRLIATSDRAGVTESGVEGVRARFPGELPRLGLGASLILVLLFLAGYLLLYLLGVH